MIVELEQRPFTEEAIELYQNNEEEKDGITGFARPSIKAGYHMALRHHLPEVPPETEWGGLSSPYADIGLTNNRVSYYLDEGPPPTNAAEEEKEEEVPAVDP